MTNTVDLSDIDGALAVAGPSLDPAGQRVAVATYRALARGEPASEAAIAVRAGMDPASVRQLLDEWGAVFRDDGGHVIGFWGLAVADMPHRIVADGRTLFAWCAWDPMFLARIIGPLDVATEDPIAGDTITYHLDGTGQIQGLSHPGSVVTFLRPDREWDEDVMATFCHHVLHFVDAASARRWTRDHPGTFVLGLPDAVELARRHTDRCFGDALP